MLTYFVRACNFDSSIVQILLFLLGDRIRKDRDKNTSKYLQSYGIRSILWENYEGSRT